MTRITGFSEPPAPDPDEPLDRRRRRLRFRSWHRGTREADLILGRFADAEIDGFGRQDLDAYEALMAHADPDLYNWLNGHEPVPDAVDTPVFRRLVAFTRDRAKVKGGV